MQNRPDAITEIGVNLDQEFESINDASDFLAQLLPSDSYFITFDEFYADCIRREFGADMNLPATLVRKEGKFVLTAEFKEYLRKKRQKVGETLKV